MKLLIISIEIFIIFLLSIAAMRIMGKTTIAQVTPYDLVAIFLFSTIAAEPLLSAGFFTNVFSLVILVVTYLFFARLTLNQRVNEFLLGEPAIVIKHGRIIEENLKKNRLSIMQLLSILRINGYPRVEDVEYAVLEPTGSLSIIPRSGIRPLAPNDLDIEVEYEGLPMSVIIDGKVQYKNLILINKGKEWVDAMLKNEGISLMEEVFLAYMNDSGSYYIDLRNGGERRGIVSSFNPRGNRGDNSQSPASTHGQDREEVAVVENGIIQTAGLRRSGLNVRELRQFLKEQGWEDLSRTGQVSIEICRKITVHEKEIKRSFSLDKG